MVEALCVDDDYPVSCRDLRRRSTSMVEALCVDDDYPVSCRDLRRRSTSMVEALCVDDDYPVSCRDLRRRSTSMVEAKEQTYNKLREELLRVQGELQLKDKECGKLERVRDQMENELEELTASLFEVSPELHVRSGRVTLWRCR